MDLYALFIRVESHSVCTQQLVLWMLSRVEFGKLNGSLRKLLCATILRVLFYCLLSCLLVFLQCQRYALRRRTCDRLNKAKQLAEPGPCGARSPAAGPVVCLLLCGFFWCVCFSVVSAGTHVKTYDFFVLVVSLLWHWHPACVQDWGQSAELVAVHLCVLSEQHTRHISKCVCTVAKLCRRPQGRRGKEGGCARVTGNPPAPGSQRRGLLRWVCQVAAAPGAPCATGSPPSTYNTIFRPLWCLFTAIQHKALTEAKQHQHTDSLFSLINTQSLQL